MMMNLQINIIPPERSLCPYVLDWQGCHAFVYFGTMALPFGPGCTWRETFQRITRLVLHHTLQNISTAGSCLCGYCQVKAHGTRQLLLLINLHPNFPWLGFLGLLQNLEKT